MSEWKMVKLGEVFERQITGEWGTECENEDGVKVLRTTNFTNNGKIDYSKSVFRCINDNKIQSKKLEYGDIILEKSGGSDLQPVGRVVYFDDTEDVYLCNNFTQALRVNSSITSSRYVFYFMFNQHKKGVTELLQNKTTGIRNLQLKSYMSIKIPLPPLEIQQKIATVLDKASSLIELRKTQIEKLDLLVKSKFIDMFGDPVTNPMGWEIKSLKNITTKIGSGATPKGGKGSYKSKGISLVRSMNVHGGCFKYDNLAYLDEKQAKQLDIVTLQDEDVLINITGASVARSCIVPSDILPARVNQHVSIIRCKSSIANPFYVNHIFMSDGYQRLLLSIGSAGGATREAITKQELEQLNIPLPPISLQTHFRIFVGQVEQQKNVLNQSLKKLETNYKALMQGCFNGELFQ